MSVIDETPFRPGLTYDNVYILFLDAAGYSSIVRDNPRDRAAHAFDLLRGRVVARTAELSARLRCGRTALWSWRGDGGCLVFHDDDESTARDCALGVAHSIMAVDLPALRAELAPAGLHGTLRLRAAVHKGPIRYAAGHDTGAIHSPDLNFAAHLERAAPADCLMISEAVHRVCGDFAGLFTPAGTYESHRVYVMGPGGSAAEGLRSWLGGRGLAGGAPVHAYAQRPAQAEKARLVDAAAETVLDLGTALHTCARYLVTTERPARYRDAVLSFLRRGGVYDCVLLDPASETTALWSQLRREDLATKIKNSLAMFARFKERHGADAGGLRVHQTPAFPGLAALGVDLHAPGALLLYSPCLQHAAVGVHQLERADMPHYLTTPASGQVFTGLLDLITGPGCEDARTRVL
ncbi:adenylate/guanylate cyclase domain-containing protein [Actinomadura roseirufa]|uniref:adenylate/guanylate cyclase domain-containing protein n=1 Tax=Actinomadura roseirufa TaxID=2094049 RepID=UPI0010418EB1|nr:adenylate/guanylate cyclase domain-containing protein [Actinomadura roseirufa]